MSTLYIASTDIGNRLDNTVRLENTLKLSDFVLVESFKEGSKLLKHFGIKKEMLEVSEHTTESELLPIIEKIKLSENVVLISDCGSPLMEDPGISLVREAKNNNIKISPLPGVSSIIAAIMVTPFSMKEFYYAGLLPRVSEERERKLSTLKKLNVPIILLDTPYRLTQVLEAIIKIFGKNKSISLCLDITTESEELIVDEVYNLLSKYKGQKREFVIIIS